ncbi:MAG: hypothetical protein J6B68_11420 [Lachnospiraceae bacterium]|nr:hypothetical protein [Lachnospiraceae bacterium]
MVNRVDGNYYNDYSQMKSVNTIQDNGEKFSLDYKQENLQSEDADKKEKEAELARSKKKAAERNGVKLELSQAAQRVQNTKTEYTSDASKEQDRPEQKSFLDTIQEIITGIIQSVKDFFYQIWNDTDAETENAAEDTTDATLEISAAKEANDVEELDAIQEFSGQKETVGQTAEEIQRQDEARIDKEIRQYLHTGDLPQVINILTDNGKRSMAKNSTLLTYYDRNGRVVEPSASDKERILHGDKGSRKL